MDLIDILMASALSPKGQSDSAAASAQEAARQARESAARVEELVENLNIPEVDFETTEDNNMLLKKVKSNNKSMDVKFYKGVGENEDGTMTQKAIKSYIDEQIQNVPTSQINFGEENSGKMIKIGETGELEPSTLTEEGLFRTQAATDTVEENDQVVGITIDYKTGNVERVQGAIGLTPGAQFNQISIYNNIKRCLVSDDGEIIAFCGDDIYMDDYTSGYQTMVYIPKFYYKRVIIEVENNIINKEQILISSKPLTGFKLHPIFKDKNENELNYFLYSAYEGSSFDTSANAYNLHDSIVDFNEDKLSSIANAKPISGEKDDLTRANAEKLATNRGEGWHISTIQAESALQMLFIIEFANLNSQNALENGISDIGNVSGRNCSSYTGSTATLNNETGHAAATINEKDSIETSYSTDGQRAISYRGIENPWGNIWRMINNIEIRGDGTQQGGVPYIYNSKTNTYEAVSFTLPNSSSWISNFGYDENFDWLFIPTAATGANSSLPIGDYIWTSLNLNSTNGVVLGGHWNFKENNGLFYYGFDRGLDTKLPHYSARLIYIPGA